MDNPWRTLKQHLVYSNRFGYRLREDDVIDPSGHRSIYMILEGGDFVTIVPVTDDNNLIFVHQWRYPLGQALIELPAGHINQSEDPFDTAVRELREEVGGVSHSWFHLASLWACVGSTKTRHYVYLARDVRQDLPVQLDGNESLTSRLIPYNQAILWASTGVFKDEKTVAALFLADRFIQTHPIDSP